MIDVTAIVVSFHRTSALDLLLSDLGGIPAIVVNIEDDPAVEEVARRHGALVVATVGNVGFGAGVNTGARSISAAAVIAFMNDDVRISGGEVRRLANTLIAAGADVVVPAVEAGDGSVEPSIAPLPTPLTLLVEWLLLPDRPMRSLGRWMRPEKWRRPAHPEVISAASATCVVTHRATLLRHPIPEEYFLYWEEMEWFWRLREAGASVLHVPDVRVRHCGGREDVRPEKSRLLARNAVRCVRRTQGRRRAALAWPVVVAWQVRLLVFDAARRRGTMSARWAGLLASVGAWRELA